MGKLPPYMIALCRELRKNQTDAEALLWACLRRKQFGGFKFRRQHPIRRYVADFCCIEEKLIIELDGEVHNDADRHDYDRRRDNELRSRGFRVMRFRNEAVLEQTENVLRKILSALTPNPFS